MSQSQFVKTYPGWTQVIEWMEKWLQFLYLIEAKSTVTANSNCHPFYNYTIRIAISYCCSFTSSWLILLSLSNGINALMHGALCTCVCSLTICGVGGRCRSGGCCRHRRRIRAIPLFRHSVRSNRLLLVLFRWNYRDLVSGSACVCHIF